MRFPAIILSLSMLLAACATEPENHRTYTGLMDTESIRVSSLVAGTVTSVRFNEGARVNKGDVLITVDTEPSQLRLDQVSAQRAELLVQMQNAQETIDKVQAEYDNVKTRYERMAALLRDGAVTRQAVDDVKTKLEVAGKNLASARNARKVLQAKLRQVEAGMDLLKRNITDAEITAPAAGVILTRYVDPGEIVGQGSPVADLADLSTMWVKFNIEERDIPYIKLGQEATVQVDGMPDREFKGVVTWISDVAEFTPKTILTEETRTSLVYRAKVTIENTDNVFKIGMPVELRLELQK
ncbi:MAG: HlyD family efflux transporter periplasmic adaptor subunit [Chlorobi bacterium]|nr:HlyD family efflux transporter periplasmic adaptor subunit [Chlorobiota bacterium]